MVPATAVLQRPTALKPSSILPANGRARRPTLVRKRDDMELADTLSSDPPSPSKKAKVSFSDEVELNVIDDWEKAPQVVREEVRLTLERHARHDDSGYNNLKAVYTTENEEDPTSPVSLRNHTAALVASVSALGRSHADLVHAVLGSDWIRRDEGYVSLYLRFLGNLVSAQGVWLSDALKMLVGKFVTNTRLRRPLLNQPDVTYVQMQNRAHAGLKYLLRLVPSASSVLASVLRSSFPHSSDSRHSHVRFARNILQIVDYSPELHTEILALITERLIKIDVQVQGDLEDLADEVGDDLLKRIPRSQDDGVANVEEEDENHTDEEEEELLDPEAQRAKDIISNVEKLDMVLDVLFTHYTELFENPSSAASSSAASILLSQFSTLILPTYRSRHTQFLLFHFMQTDPSLVDTFVGTCLTLSFDKSRPALIRESAAAYLASFVSRGAHVPKPITVDVFNFIGEQLKLLRADYEPGCRGPDPRRYHTFYALTQALLYIFCFRWRDLCIDGDDDSLNMSPPGLPHAIATDHDDDLKPTFLPGIKDVLHATVFSPLNPLRVCSPIIVNEFAHITRQLDLLYVFHVLETNKRVRLVHSISSSTTEQRGTALSSRRDEDWMCLEAYFPFDPYKLPRSRRWIDADYREWQGLDADERGGDDDSDEDEDEGSADEEEATGTEDEDEED